MQLKAAGLTIFALFCLINLSSTVAHAQSHYVNKSTTAAAPKVVAPKNWDVALGLEAASTLHTSDSYERQAQESLTVAPSYKFAKGWKISASIMAYKDEGGGEDGGNSGFDNTSATVSYARPLTPYTTWITALTGVAPTDQNLRNDTSYQGAVKLGTGFNFDGLIHGSSLNYMATVGRNFHEFEIDKDGKFNLRDSFAQALTYNFPFTRAVSLTTQFVYSLARTYSDDMRTKFVAGADLGWQVTKAFSVSVGTSNEGSALQPNGVDSNVRFYDDNTSVIKLGLTYVL
jgi:hypothetical protein